MTEKQKKFIEFQMKKRAEFSRGWLGKRRENMFAYWDFEEIKADYRSMLLCEAMEIWGVGDYEYLPNECWEAYLWQP